MNTAEEKKTPNPSECTRQLNTDFKFGTTVSYTLPVGTTPFDLDGLPIVRSRISIALAQWLLSVHEDKEISLTQVFEKAFGGQLQCQYTPAALFALVKHLKKCETKKEDTGVLLPPPCPGNTTNAPTPPSATTPDQSIVLVFPPTDFIKDIEVKFACENCYALLNPSQRQLVYGFYGIPPPMTQLTCPVEIFLACLRVERQQNNKNTKVKGTDPSPLLEAIECALKYQVNLVLVPFRGVQSTTVSYDDLSRIEQLGIYKLTSYPRQNIYRISVPSADKAKLVNKVVGYLANNQEGVHTGYPLRLNNEGDTWELSITARLTPYPMQCAECGRYRCCQEPEFKVCGKCKLVSYCSVQCQRNGWQAHKGSCKVPKDAFKDNAKVEMFVVSGSK